MSTALRLYLNMSHQPPQDASTPANPNINMVIPNARNRITYPDQASTPRQHARHRNRFIGTCNTDLK